MAAMMAFAPWPKTFRASPGGLTYGTFPFGTLGVADADLLPFTVEGLGGFGCLLVGGLLVGSLLGVPGCLIGVPGCLIALPGCLVCGWGDGGLAGDGRSGINPISR